ncbi:hypothetical protein FB561_3963 [Kribbella amoyensis]|uniref:Uncharacterized protein n=1 Tax=Kribbella amoyensis TaxID=996641 RepID=A0A561BVB7_9ACTN|nr:hypothetical protein [Kribbella amoyensis]TWD82820.1 hypothetical protein FB561_3963 [Kribbella amoyensis]
MTVNGLPNGAAAKVRVEGAGDHWDLAGSRELDVNPGRYTVTVLPVRVSASSRHGIEEPRTVVVEPGRTLVVDASYLVTVPDTTKIIDDAATRPRIVAVAANQVVISRGPYSDRLRLGDTILAGHGPKTPGGLCVKVVGITVNAGTVVVRTAPARLLEALPDGRLTFSGAPVEHGLDGEFAGTVPLGPVEARVHRKGRLAVDLQDSEVRWRSDGDYLDVLIHPKLSYDEQWGYEVAAEITDEKGRVEVPLKSGIGQLKHLCGAGLVIKILKLTLPVSCQIKGILSAAPTVRGAVSGSWTGSGVFDGRFHWRSDRATKPEYEVVSQPLDWTFDTVLVAEGKLKAAAGVWIGITTGKSIADLDVGLEVTFEGTETITRTRPKGGPVTVSAAADFGAKVGLSAELNFVAGLIDGPSGELNVAYRPIKSWSEQLSPGDLNTRAPGYSKQQVRDAVETVAKSHLPNGYRLFDGAAACPDPRSGCEFASPAGGTTWQFNAVAEPRDFITLSTTAYRSDQEARYAADRARRQLAAFEGRFAVPATDPSATSSRPSTFGLDGQGAFGIESVFEWPGHGLLRQYEEVPTPRILEELRHRGCDSPSNASARGCGGPFSWQDQWMVVASHNLVLTGHVKQPLAAAEKNTAYLRTLRTVLEDFVTAIGQPSGVAGY